jgi:hypothetical protein
LGEGVENVEIMIEGYRIYRKARSQIKQEKHGGVLLYVKNDIITCDCDDLNKIQAESIWCKIVNKTEKSTEIVVVVLRDLQQRYRRLKSYFRFCKWQQRERF